MKILVFLFFINIQLMGQNNSCTQLDIILLGDFSSSVKDERPTIIKTYKQFVDNLNINKININVGIVLFGDNARTIINLSDNKIKIKNEVNKMDTVDLGMSTNLYSGLELSKQILENYGREGIKKFIILISDGDPNNEVNSMNKANEIKLNNIKICGVYIENNVGSKEYMKEISSFQYYFESNYRVLIHTLNNLNFCF